MKLTVDDTKADRTFVYYALRAPLGQHEILSRALTAGVPHINLGLLGQVQIPSPPLAIQRKVAAILSAYDHLIENNNHRIKILEEMAQRVCREWFVHFRYPGHESVRLVETEFGPIPQEWNWRELREVAEEMRVAVDPVSVHPSTPYVGLEHLPEDPSQSATGGRQRKLVVASTDSRSATYCSARFGPTSTRCALFRLMESARRMPLSFERGPMVFAVSFWQSCQATRSSKRRCRHLRAPRCQGQTGMSWNGTGLQWHRRCWLRSSTCS